ncbi:MAG TPA: preprotein translocase subunit SecE [Tepiditoga sp.]|nr:preprotein translocase subunit SecE [Thermotogota bacterium]HOO74067.1 preprotein translocase subunit SecE [Tepiditoga sp.]
MSKFWLFLSSVWQEVKKINWPSKKNLMSSTGIVLVIILFVTLYLFVADLGLSALFDNIIYPLMLGTK